MKNSPLEAGLLSIFRLFLGIQLGLIVLNVLLHIHLGQVVGCPFCIVAVAAAGVSLLVGYLSWPLLQERLGRFYLPLALALSIFLSLLVQNELLQSFLDRPGLNSDENAWQIFLFLFFPLVLIAWQYNFRTVVFYSFLSAGLEALMLHFGNYQWFHQVSYQRSILVRTVVFLAVGYVIALIMQRQRQQRQSLLEANRRLRHYAATLEQLTITQERNRMAHELHDTLAHTLSGLAIQLEAARSLWQSSPERTYTLLEESLQATRAGLAESRKAIQALRAGPLENLGLVLALRNLAENAASRSGAALDLALPARLEKLSPDIEQCLFRVAQEALENIVRHAGARQITVRLALEEAGVVLCVCDDGQGFDPARVDGNKHFGLKGLHERVAAFTGDLQIFSRAGEGTRVCLRLESGQA
ncbi:MAG: sensor histidine kinase [Chloroflexota bacterium]